MLAAILLLIAGQAQAIDLLKIHEVYFEHRALAPYSRVPILPPGEFPTGYYAIYLDIALIWRVHFRSRVHAMTTNRQFRTVGWEYWLGVRPADFIELGIYHHSQHVLDYPGNAMPLEDGIYLKLWFDRF